MFCLLKQRQQKSCRLQNTSIMTRRKEGGLRERSGSPKGAFLNVCVWQNQRWRPAGLTLCLPPSTNPLLFAALIRGNLSPPCHFSACVTALTNRHATGIHTLLISYLTSSISSSEPLNFTWRADCRSHQMGRRAGCQVGFSHGNAQIHLLVKGFWHQTDPSESCLHSKVEERLHVHPDYGAGVQRSRIKVWLLRPPKHFFPAVIAGLPAFCGTAAQ